MTRLRALCALGVIAALTVLPGCAGNFGAKAEFTPVDVGTIPTEATKPGTTLALGETAWIHEDDKAGMIGVTVREIRELDPAKIQDFVGNPEFDGTKPYAVVTQFNWNPASKTETQLRSVALLPVQEDGHFASWMAHELVGVDLGDADACNIALPKVERGSGVGFECFVALGESAPVVGAEYNGSPRNQDPPIEDHPFAADPILWLS